MDIRVRDKKRNIITVITHKAYAALGPQRYEKLGPVEETVTTPVQTTPQIHRAVSAPVIRPVIEPQASEPEQTKEEIQTVAEPETQPKRRGRQPGSKNKISSNSTEDEK